jgi:hypothetical protein
LVIGLNLLANNITNFVWSDAYHSFTVLPLDNLTKMNVKLIKQICSVFPIFIKTIQAIMLA